MLLILLISYETFNKAWYNPHQALRFSTYALAERGGKVPPCRFALIELELRGEKEHIGHVTRHSDWYPNLRFGSTGDLRGHANDLKVGVCNVFFFANKFAKNGC